LLDTADVSDLGRLRALPRAEVHLHLEGCFEAADLAELAHRRGVPLPRPAESLFDVPGGLSPFLDFLSWACSLVDDRETAAQVARDLGDRLRRAGTRHGDVIVNPVHWHAWRHDLPGLVDALDAGWRDVEADGGPTVGLCVSILRSQSAAEAADLVDLLVALRHPRVVALSIDGDERVAGRVSARFADAFHAAGAAGLARTVHAGESSGPEGVRDALDLLGADRIDHGVRAVEDPALVRELADRGVPLGVCPTSNLTLGLYADLQSHPLDELRRAGVQVSVNTDDPGFFGTSLDQEYAAAAQAFGWTDEDLRAVAATSIRASFAPAEVKDSLLADLAAW
jgi:adenosine deaminase